MDNKIKYIKALIFDLTKQHDSIMHHFTFYKIFDICITFKQFPALVMQYQSVVKGFTKTPPEVTY